MKVAIDSGPLTGGHAVRGVGFHTSELIEALQKQRKGLEKIIIDEFDFSQNKKSLASGRYDIIHYSYFHPHKMSLPIRHKGKLVVTIHDLIPLIYPKQYPGGIKGAIRYRLQRFLIKKVDAIITISETSKKDIIRFLSFPSRRIFVVYDAPRTIFRRIRNDSVLKRVKREYDLPAKFVLYVGDVNYNKNVVELIKACREINIHLVIVGKHALEVESSLVGLPDLKGPKDWIRFLFDIPHPEQAHFSKLKREFVMSKKMIRTGFIPDEDLVAVYNLATVYCQPSLYEGFGLPVLEAMACGTPTVISKTQALVEVAGVASEITTGNTSRDLAISIGRLIKNKNTRDEYIKKGLTRVKDFSWDKTAKETFRIYRNLLAS